MPAFLTIGHSTRSIVDFVALLQGSGAQLVVDVRAIPRSRTNPQFNIETLPESLAVHGIGYQHLAELGGRRGRITGHSPNDFWENDSFRNYADSAATAPFRSGLERLRSLGQRQACAIMCAEAVWWRCHRRIIADYLLFAGESVFHVLAPGKTEPAKLTPAARSSHEGTLIYAK